MTGNLLFNGSFQGLQDLSVILFAVLVFSVGSIFKLLKVSIAYFLGHLGHTLKLLNYIFMAFRNSLQQCEVCSSQYETISISSACLVFYQCKVPHRLPSLCLTKIRVTKLVAQILLLKAKIRTVSYRLQCSYGNQLSEKKKNS